MEATFYLQKYSQKIESYKKAYFTGEIKKAARINRVAKEALIRLRDYSTGGKCLRGVLTILGYELAGGGNFEKVLPAAVAVELFHNALLIHDDFIDRDSARRGKPTVHKIYGEEGGKHYGASMAIVVGDLAIFSANRLIASLKLPENLVSRAVETLNGYLIDTGYGEMMDIAFDLKKEITWNDIFKVRLYKTARYTFVMPLVTGAVLGGGNKKIITNFIKYAEPVGMAFQLRDDILGIFGDPAKTGKSNDSDIKEGKKTLIFLKALELTKGTQREYLKRYYGSVDLNPERVKKIKGIIKTSGALGFSEKTSREIGRASCRERV